MSCYKFEQGMCFRGDSCRYRHTSFLENHGVDAHQTQEANKRHEFRQETSRASCDDRPGFPSLNVDTHGRSLSTDSNNEQIFIFFHHGYH